MPSRREVRHRPRASPDHLAVEVQEGVQDGHERLSGPPAESRKRADVGKLGGRDGRGSEVVVRGCAGLDGGAPEEGRHGLGGAAAQVAADHGVTCEGTVRTWAPGIREATRSASGVGVRMSCMPERISVGTSGRGARAGGGGDALGQETQSGIRLVARAVAVRTGKRSWVGGRSAPPVLRRSAGGSGTSLPGKGSSSQLWWQTGLRRFRRRIRAGRMGRERRVSDPRPGVPAAAAGRDRYAGPRPRRPAAARAAPGQVAAEQDVEQPRRRERRRVAPAEPVIDGPAERVLGDARRELAQVCEGTGGDAVACVRRAELPRGSERPPCSWAARTVPVLRVARSSPAAGLRRTGDSVRRTPERPWSRRRFHRGRAFRSRRPRAGPRCPRPIPVS